MLARLPSGSREAGLTLTTDNGTTVHFIAFPGNAGPARDHAPPHGLSSPAEGTSYIERFHRSLKEEEVWAAEYRSLEEARDSIARWIAEYNQTGLIAESKIALPTRLLGFCN